MLDTLLDVAAGWENARTASSCRCVCLPSNSRRRIHSEQKRGEQVFPGELITARQVREGREKTGGIPDYGSYLTTREKDSRWNRRNPFVSAGVRNIPLYATALDNDTGLRLFARRRRVGSVRAFQQRACPKVGDSHTAVIAFQVVAHRRHLS